MNTLDVAAAVLDALNQVQASYLMVGALSSNLYGIPRNTNDADFVFAAATTDVSAIAAVLGAGFRLDPQLSFESITMTLRRVITHIETGFLIEFFELSDDPHDQMRFRRRQQMPFLNRRIFVPTVEDVIVAKLRWSKHVRRSKDIDDVKNILVVQDMANIDLPYIRTWAQAHHTIDLLNQLLADTGPKP